MQHDMAAHHSAPAPNLYDRRAERTYAAGLAAQQRAAAEAIRADAAIRLRRAEREEQRQDAFERERARLISSNRWKTRRANARAAVRDSAVRFAPLAAGGAAMGAPILLAWSGQLAFGVEVMQLGPLAAMVPIALEGAVWYVAYLVHRASQLGLPTGVYRAWAWILAGVAAGMNFWHGASSAGGVQRGAVLALASLLGVGLWELTVRLRERRQRGRTVAEARTAMARRIRYPRISWTAWSIRTALGPGCSAEEAWTMAWERWNPAPADADSGEVRTVRRAYVFHRGAPRTAPVRRALVFRTAPRTEAPPTVRLARTFAFRKMAAATPVRIVRRAFTFQPSARTEPVQPPVEVGPQPADKDTFAAELRGEILAAAARNEKWGPDYDALMARARRSRSWVEKRVREARTALIRTDARTGVAA
ncbi:DUF2637 domain-containing protein [Nonomuraea angiospora]